MLEVILFTAYVFGPIIALLVFMSLRTKWRFRGFSTRARRVEARLQGVREGVVGGEDPYWSYVIVWRWQHPETHELHFFKSKEFHDDPTPYVDRYKVVHVLVDPDHPDCYRLDEPGLERFQAEVASEVQRETQRRFERIRNASSDEELNDTERKLREILAPRGRARSSGAKPR